MLRQNHKLRGDIFKRLCLLEPAVEAETPLIHTHSDSMHNHHISLPESRRIVPAPRKWGGGGGVRGARKERQELKEGRTLRKDDRVWME